MLPAHPRASQNKGTRAEHRGRGGEGAWPERGAGRGRSEEGAGSGEGVARARGGAGAARVPDGRVSVGVKGPPEPQEAAVGAAPSAGHAPSGIQKAQGHDNEPTAACSPSLGSQETGEQGPRRAAASGPAGPRLQESGQKVISDGQELGRVCTNGLSMSEFVKVVLREGQ